MPSIRNSLQNVDTDYERNINRQTDDVFHRNMSFIGSKNCRCRFFKIENIIFFAIDESKGRIM